MILTSLVATSTHLTVLIDLRNIFKDKLEITNLVESPSGKRYSFFVVPHGDGQQHSSLSEQRYQSNIDALATEIRRINNRANRVKVSYHVTSYG